MTLGLVYPFGNSATAKVEVGLTNYYKKTIFTYTLACKK